MSKKNVSKKIKNGTAVLFKDKNLEHGKNTKDSKHEIRLGHVIDTNSKNEVAIAKRQHAKHSIQVGENYYNPNFKTKDKNGKPLKIDNKTLKRASKKQDITPKEANEIKKQGLKTTNKNIRKPNKRKLKELKGRK